MLLLQDDDVTSLCLRLSLSVRNSWLLEIEFLVTSLLVEQKKLEKTRKILQTRE